MPKQGDIVLIPVPFTDLSSQKQRPVIVISNDAYNQKTEDVVVVALTSQPEVTAYGFTITSADLAQGVLKRPSQVRIDKIYTLSQSIIVRTFGRVNENVLERISSLFQKLIEK
jgi:mRNA interferase MazF